jgi:hypothetical protein
MAYLEKEWLDPNADNSLGLGNYNIRTVRP